MNVASRPDGGILSAAARYVDGCATQRKDHQHNRTHQREEHRRFNRQAEPGEVEGECRLAQPEAIDGDRQHLDDQRDRNNHRQLGCRDRYFQCVHHRQIKRDH